MSDAVDDEQALLVPPVNPDNPSDPYARAAETFPRLTADQVDRVAAFGEEEDVSVGTVLFARDDRSVDFFLVLDGHIEIYEPGPDGPDGPVITIHARHQFTGEVDLFNDRAILVGGRMGVDGRVVRVRRAQFRRLLAAEPDIAEIVMRAFILRRAGFIEHGQAAVTVVGSRRSADSLRIQRFLSRNGHPFVVYDPADGAEIAARVDALLVEHGRPDLTAETADAAGPIVICGTTAVLDRPDNTALAACLGIAEQLDPHDVVDLAVVGAGPAGLAAAVYGASEGLSTLVLETEAPGGQAGTSSRIENYLGFPTGLSGQSLASRAQVQAQKFGARIAVPRAIVGLDVDATPFRLRVEDGSTVAARAVVVATGARYRTLDGVAELHRFEGAGVHYAATAIEAGLCEDEEVVIVGGGNSAGQAAVFLSRTARLVHVVIRGADLGAGMSDYLVQRLTAAPDRITVHVRTEVTAVDGERHLTSVTLTDRTAGVSSEITTANLFLMLGAVPNTEWLQGVVQLDENGFVCTGAAARADGGDLPTALETSRPGVFAVGDVRAGSTKRVASAVGEGSIVVADVHRRIAADEQPPSRTRA